MTYDITMCNCDTCTKAGTCHRWLQFRRYLDDKSTGKPVFVSMHSAADGQINESCPVYWEEKGTRR